MTEKDVNALVGALSRVRVALLENPEDKDAVARAGMLVAVVKGGKEVPQKVLAEFLALEKMISH